MDGDRTDEEGAEFDVFISYSRRDSKRVRELFDYLRGHGWRVYICSGGGRDFMRVFSEETFGFIGTCLIPSR